MKLHSINDLREQISFISYYFHWSYEEIVNLTHFDRREYCEQIMRIHQLEKGEHISILDIK